MNKVRRSRKTIINSSITAGLCFLSSLGAQAATDPGVRGGAADAGPNLLVSGLNADELGAFAIAHETFDAVDSVLGEEGPFAATEPDEGLGPTFNHNSCAACHAFPASGGTSPRQNTQFDVAVLHGARNVIPSFLLRNGPIREVRFKRNADGSRDGGVHSLFVITGRPDAPAGFNLAQTNFAAQPGNNLSFRIPTPLFGAGLIETITERTLEQNLRTNVPNAPTKAALGITGKLNRSGNDGTVQRFGWKAQNKSLMMFAGEAYNVEQGVTNDLFPNTRELANQSMGDQGSPESGMDLATGGIGDIEQFTIFMRLLDAPRRRNPAGASSASVAAGATRFRDIGCVQCHTPSMTTGVSNVAALSNKPVPLFSDLAVHNMGFRLADEISQGDAGDDEFRTAPLWGLGQRIFFLHDGRFTDLDQTIREHASEARAPFGPSEANAVVANYINLPDNQKQELFNFLRSL